MPENAGCPEEMFSQTAGSVRTDKRKPEDSEIQTRIWMPISTPNTPPATKRRKATATKHEEDVWESQKPVIRELFAQHTIQEIAEKMEKEHGFEASISQYKAKVSKWGLKKYNKISRKDLNFVLQKLRVRYPKGTAIRKAGKKLNSRNVQRQLERHLKAKSIDVSSLISAMSSCDLSCYTSSTKGVKIPPGSPTSNKQPGSGKRSAEINDPLTFNEPDEEVDINCGLSGIREDYSDTVPKVTGYSKIRIETLVRHEPLDLSNPSTKGPLHMLPDKSSHKFLDKALRQVDTLHDTFNVLAGEAPPEEIKVILYYLHLSGSMAHCAWPGLSLYCIDNYTQTTRYGIKCNVCGYGKIYMIPPGEDESAIIHRQKFNTWPQGMFNFVNNFTIEHNEVILHRKRVLQESQYKGADLGLSSLRETDHAIGFTDALKENPSNEYDGGLIKDSDRQDDEKSVISVSELIKEDFIDTVAAGDDDDDDKTGQKLEHVYPGGHDENIPSQQYHDITDFQGSSSLEQQNQNAQTALVFDEPNLPKTECSNHSRKSPGGFNVGTIVSAFMGARGEQPNIKLPGFLQGGFFLTGGARCPIHKTCTIGERVARDSLSLYNNCEFCYTES